jgi:hypothetical protein
MDPSDSPQQPGGAAKGNPPSQKPPTCDVKPRLTKEQHDVLEQHFQVQHKPSTLVKKDFASKLGVPLDKINVSAGTRRMRPCANWVVELVPEPKSQGQAGPQESRKPAEHGPEYAVRHVRTSAHARHGRTVSAPPGADPNANDDEPGVPWPAR